MKIVIRTLIFHLCCILLFTYLYLHLSDHFNNSNFNSKQSTFLDYLLLSTTIQAGVGFSNLYPNTFYSKLSVIVQQFLMMMTHIITLYIFTL